jgi:hypothetical protein
MKINIKKRNSTQIKIKNKPKPNKEQNNGEMQNALHRCHK